jgi:hypothetical protein
MSALHTFFGEFWWMFLLVSAIWCLVQWGRRVSLEGTAAVFVTPKSFRELAGLSRSEQKRLLHAADREAFPRWRFFLPTIIYAAEFAGVLAIARVWPDSFAVSLGLGVCSIAFCCWIGARWEARRIRPFLQNHIEGTCNA